MIRKVFIKYQIASYSGEDFIYITEEDMDNEQILSRWWSIFKRRQAPFPYGIQTAKIVKTVWMTEEEANNG